jgi:hypothetical protein
MATRRATTTEPDYEQEEDQEEQETEEEVPAAEPQSTAISEHREKFLNGEMTWRELCEAEQQ